MSTPLTVDGTEAMNLATPSGGHAQVGGGVEDVAIAKELAVKENIAALRKAWKEDRFRKAAEAEVYKILQSVQMYESSSKKRVRKRDTIKAYFLSI